MSDITEGAQIFQQGVQDLTQGAKSVAARKAAKATAEKQAYVGSLLADTPEGQTGLGQVGTAAVSLGLAEPWQVAGDMMKLDPIKLMTMIGRDAFLKNDPKLKEAFNAMGSAFGRGLEIEAYSKAKGALLAKAKYGGDGSGGGKAKPVTTKAVQPLDGQLLWDPITNKFKGGKITIPPYEIPGAINNGDTNKPVVIDLSKSLEPQLTGLLKEGYSQEQLNDINRYVFSETMNVQKQALVDLVPVFRNPAAMNYLEYEAAALAQRVLTSGQKAFFDASIDEDGNPRTDDDGNILYNTSLKIPLGEVDNRLFDANQFANDAQLDVYKKINYLKSQGADDSFFDGLSAVQINEIYNETIKPEYTKKTIDAATYYLNKMTSKDPVKEKIKRLFK